jgi:hypothetical protein
MTRVVCPTGTMPNRVTKRTADSTMLDVLVYEFPFDDRRDAERRIKQRLRYHHLGPYCRERVDLLRRFVAKVSAEIHSGSSSCFYLGSHGRFAALEDFDLAGLARDLARAFPQIRKTTIKCFVPCAIYLYYLR